MAVTMVSGNAGRLKVSPTSTTATVATVKSWTLTKTTNPVPVPTFESPTQAGVGGATLLYPEVLLGLSQATVSVEGFFDVGTAPTDSLISNGSYYYLDLILEKGTPYGFNNVYAICTSFKAGTNVENQAASFTAEFTTSGVVPLSGAVT